MERAGAQCIAVNDVASSGAGFESDTNSLIVIGNDGAVSDTIAGTKTVVGEKLVALVAARATQTPSSRGRDSQSGESS
jgi:phosphopantothenoylcysteine synthetase/decarboxylase